MTEDKSIVYRVGAPPNTAKQRKPRRGLLIVLIAGGAAMACLLGSGIILAGGLAMQAGESPPATPTASVKQEPPVPAPAVTTAEPPAVHIPSDQVISGKGDKVVKLAALNEDFVFLARIVYNGGSNFAVVSRGSSGDYIDLVVNEIGKYVGTRPITLEDYPAALEVKASGSWKITIFPAQKAPKWTGSASGKGDSVFLVPEGTLSSLAVVKVTHTGSHNFIVHSYGDDPDLLINEIGRYSGEVLMNGGTVLIEIVADGAWTINKV